MTPEAVEPLFEKRMDGFSIAFHMLSHAKIGASTIQSRATAGVAGATFIFCLPGSPGACRDGWDGILAAQLDYRTQPCNFVEIMPRLDEHLRRPKAQGRVGLARHVRAAPRAAGAARSGLPDASSHADRKYFWIFRKVNHVCIAACRPDQEGRFASSRTRGRETIAVARLDEAQAERTAMSCGPDGADAGLVRCSNTLHGDEG